MPLAMVLREVTRLPRVGMQKARRISRRTCEVLETSKPLRSIVFIEFRSLPILLHLIHSFPSLLIRRKPLSKTALEAYYIYSLSTNSVSLSLCERWLSPTTWPEISF